MIPNEIAWFVGLIVFGSILGIVSGVIAAKKAKGMGAAIMGAILLGIIMPLCFCFITGFFKAHQPSGFSITNALLTGVGVMFFYGIQITAFIAPTSLFSSIASYAVFRNCPYKLKEPSKSGDSNPH